MKSSKLQRWRTNLHLASFRRRFWRRPPNSVVHFLDYTVRITDGPNFYIQYKDEFIRRIYHFEAARPDPLIIDGGSNMGTSIFYFKSRYPRARIIGFEPDAALYRLLQENVTRNNLQDVRLIEAGLGGQAGTTSFAADGSSGGQLVAGGGSVTVKVDVLSNYLNEPVDFVKLNIEGQELAVLQEVEAAGKLRNIREMVIEYHGWPDGRQCLGDLLNLLDREGFRYLIHDFDAETCSVTKPPFQFRPQVPWFCLVYARNTK